MDEFDFTLDTILTASPAALGSLSVAQRLDQLIDSTPSVQQRVDGWNRVATVMEAKGMSSGHAHFRLGILHLFSDTDEGIGISHLERAYEQDQRFVADREPHRLAAYRVLSLVRDFLEDLRTKKNWRALQLDPNHRRGVDATRKCRINCNETMSPLSIK